MMDADAASASESSSAAGPWPELPLLPYGRTNNTADALEAWLEHEGWKKARNVFTYCPPGSDTAVFVWHWFVARHMGVAAWFDAHIHRRVDWRVLKWPKPSEFAVVDPPADDEAAVAAALPLIKQLLDEFGEGLLPRLEAEKTHWEYWDMVRDVTVDVTDAEGVRVYPEDMKVDPALVMLVTQVDGPFREMRYRVDRVAGSVGGHPGYFLEVASPPLFFLCDPAMSVRRGELCPPPLCAGRQPAHVAAAASPPVPAGVEQTHKG